jgi:peptidoglycan/LPS O-acetylase OafA/YrhL
MQTATKTPKPRLLGIDFCRGLATYAVVLLHSGDDTWGAIDQFTLRFRSLFEFPVPFFLAASFYFMLKKQSTNISDLWQARFRRIVIPYLVWSGFYLISKAFLLFVSNHPEKIRGLFNDPLGIIFFGTTSFHLYFLPLLISGIFLIGIAEYLNIRKFQANTLACFAACSIAIYTVLVASENSFNLGPNIAFAPLFKSIDFNGNKNPFLRLIFVEIAWFIRCSAYIFTALVLHRILSKLNQNKINYPIITGLLTFVFIFCNIFGKSLFPQAILEILLAYSLLLFGIFSSRYINDNHVMQNLGLCSFGIYLLHPFCIQILQMVFSKVAPELISQVSVISILVFSIPTFLMSWVIVLILLKNKTIAKYLFGI